MIHPVLFIWREVPIDVDIEMYERLIQAWKNDVFVISAHGELPERKLAGIHSSISTIILEEDPLNKQRILSLISLHPDAIHVFAGMRGETWRYAKYCMRHGNNRIVTLGERPNRQYTLIKDAASFSLNTIRRIRYQSKINARIQMGNLGVESSIRYGWKREKVFPFMYCPNTQHLPNTCPEQLSKRNIRFLYLGRFSRRYKGIDLLMKAVDLLDAGAWSIDFVGDYGDDVSLVHDWASSKSNVTICGAWKQNEIVKNMQSYNVVIIPSTYDGWNLNVNYAIQAGIGCIASDNCGSSDLIISGQTGEVFTCDDVKDLAEKMRAVIKNPACLSAWKTNTEKIKAVITPQTVSNYLISILEYTCLHSGIEPVCPWAHLERLI